MSARAQVVVGTVRDEHGQPVPLVHMCGMDSLSSARASVGIMTDIAGHFVLRLPLRLRYLGARRIGFTPERARTLEWRENAGRTLDTVNVELVLQSIPYELPTSFAGTKSCKRLDALAIDSRVRALWDAAAGAILAREAFLSSYRYDVAATHRDVVGKDSVREYDTKETVAAPRASLPEDLLSAPLATYKAPARGRPPRLCLRSPGDRLLMHPQFAERFCFDDDVINSDDDGVEIQIRELGRFRSMVEVFGTIAFKQSVPGPSLVAWRYTIDGRLVGSAEQRFGVENISRVLFPLVSQQSLTLFDARTGKSIGEASIRMRYSGLAPIARR